VEVPKARLERDLVERPNSRGAAFSLENSQSCWFSDIMAMMIIYVDDDG